MNKNEKLGDCDNSKIAVSRITRNVFFASLLIVCTVPARGGTLLDAAKEYTGKKQYKLALPLYEQISREEPNDVQKMCDLALCLLRTRKNQEAEVVLKRALEQNPRSAPTSYLLAIMESKNARYEVALSYIETSINTDPSYPAYRLLKATLLIQLGRVSEAKAVLASVGSGSEVQKASERASLAVAEGDAEAGKNQMLDILASDPNDIGTKFEYATIVLNAATVNPDEALRAKEFMEDVVTKSDMTPMEIAPDCLLFFVLANAQASVGKFDLALSFLDKATESYEARCGVPKSEFDRARELFEKGSRFVPKVRRGIPK